MRLNLHNCAKQTDLQGLIFVLTSEIVKVLQKLTIKMVHSASMQILSLVCKASIDTATETHSDFTFCPTTLCIMTGLFFAIGRLSCYLGKQ